MNMNDLLDLAAKELPPGWEITIHVENGFAGFDLNDPFGMDVEMTGEIEDLEMRFLELIKVARGEL